MNELLAPAKLNLALIVGPIRPDGKHEVATVLQRITLADSVALESSRALEIAGFSEDTIVRAALERLARAAGVEPAWKVHIHKQIPVAAGLGGGSSDAAAALRLANSTLPSPLAEEDLHRIAAALGADVPFFLTEGPQLGEGDGTTLTPLDLPRDYWVVVVLPREIEKESTAAVYAAFDQPAGFEERRASLLRAVAVGDVAALPSNDLVSSPLSRELVDRGAFRADVSGAGPAVYGLFSEEVEAVTAIAAIGDRGQTWLATPAC